MYSKNIVNYIPTDLLSIVMGFLDSKSKTNFLRTCKYIKDYFYKTGYSNFIKADMHTDMMDFIEKFHKHNKTIKTVKISCIDNPLIWIPEFKNTMIFENCTIDEYINPEPHKKSYNTVNLKITDYNRSKHNKNLRINYDKFNNLENLELCVYKSNHSESLFFCKKIKKVNIY